MKKIKIAYLVSTGLITALMLMSAGMYLFNHEEVSGMFTLFGYPTYIIYPLATAKILGLVAIWGLPFKSLKEWAYAGFFFGLLLAVGAHLGIGDGGHFPALIAIVLLLISYFSNKKLTE
tara:strand:+ start:3200 stop:3556 length:357 start_codon:yes stop_codon:yes gene_type:complete